MSKERQDQLKLVMASSVGNAMLELSAKGVEEICALQKQAILTADQTGPADLASLVSSFGKS